MSYHFLKPAAVIVCGAIFGYSVVQFFKPEPKDRFIASAQISKLGHQQISRSLFDVRLDLQGLAGKDDAVSTLKVVVEALKPAGSGLVYKWNLPPGVAVISGSQSEILAAFSAGEKREFEIQVKGFSKQQKKFASFEIDGTLNDYKIHREVLISSRVEDALEYLIQQKELEKAKSANKMGQKTKTRFSPENVVR